MRILFCSLLFLFSVWFVVTADAQGARGLKAADVVTKVEQAYEGINDYTVTLDVVVNIERVSVQPMHAVMYFKKPDKVHFESKGLFLLPPEGLVYDPAAIRSRYSITEPAVKDTLHGKSVYRITLVPKGERRRATKLFAMVDPMRWTIEKVMSEPNDGRQVWGDFSYVRVDRWWLPAELTMRFSSAEGDTTRSEMPEQAPMARPQMPNTGSANVHYSDYRVNIGLSDDIFTRSEGAE